MQNAMDSFYEVLRGRLATLNPERTIVVRGVTRPGLVTDGSETESVAALPDCFHLRWTDAAMTQEGCMPMVSQVCEFSYATAGTAMNGGLDRGRALAAMDGELLSAVLLPPKNAVKNDFSGLRFGGAVKTMGTRIWWSDVTFEPIKVNRNQLTRVAKVQVMSYQEAGEL